MVFLPSYFVSDFARIFDRISLIRGIFKLLVFFFEKQHGPNFVQKYEISTLLIATHSYKTRQACRVFKKKKISNKFLLYRMNWD